MGYLHICVGMINAEHILEQENHPHELEDKKTPLLSPIGQNLLLEHLSMEKNICFHQTQKHSV